MRRAIMRGMILLPLVLLVVGSSAETNGIDSILRFAPTKEHFCHWLKMSGKETLINSVIVRVSRLMHQVPFEKMHFLAKKAGSIAEECCEYGAEENCFIEKRKNLSEVFCGNEEMKSNSTDVAKCCKKEREDRPDCFWKIKPKVKSDEKTALEAISPEELCTKFSNHKTDFQTRVLYHISPILATSLPRQLLILSSIITHAAEECCAEDNKTTCFEQKKADVKHLYAEALKKGQETCHELEELGTERYTARIVMRIAQRAGELEFEETLKLAQIFVKMLGHCCQHTCILRKSSTLKDLLCLYPGVVKYPKFYKCCHMSPDEASTCFDELRDRQPVPYSGHHHVETHAHDDHKDEHCHDEHHHEESHNWAETFACNPAFCTTKGHEMLYRMIFEVARRFPTASHGWIADLAVSRHQLQNICCSKLIRFRAEEERAKAIGRIFCRRFRTMGEKGITQRAFVRVSQEVPSIKQEAAMKIAEEVAHKADKCCQRHHAACLHDELHLVLDVICKHASELPPDAHRCCLIAGQGRLPCFDKLRPHREMGVFITNPTLHLLCRFQNQSKHHELENFVLFAVAKRFPRAAAHLVIHLAHDVVGIDKKCCNKHKDHDSHEEQQIDHYHAHHRHNGKHSHSHHGSHSHSHSHGDSHEHHNDSSHSHSHEHHQHGSHSHSHEHHNDSSHSHSHEHHQHGSHSHSLEHHNDSSHSHSHEHHQHGSHSHSHEHHDHHHKHGKSYEHEHFPHFEVDLFGHHIKHDDCVEQEAHRAAEFMYAAERQERRICHSLKLSGRNHYHHKEIVLLSQHYPSLPFDVVEKFAHTFTHMVMRCCNPGGAFPWISHDQKHDETSLFPGCYEKKIFQFVDMMCAEKEFLDNVPDAKKCCESSGFKRKHCLMSMETEGGMTSHTHRPFPNSTAELFSRISCLYHDLEHHRHIDWVLWKLSHLMPGLGLSDILKLMLELQGDHEKCCHIPKSLECLTKQNEEFNTHIYSMYDNMDNECKELLEKKEHYHDKLLMEWARDIPNVPFSTLAHKIESVLQHSKFACPKDHLPAIHHMKDHIKEVVCTLGGACCFMKGESHAHDEETHLETHLDKLLVNDVCHGALKHPEELRCRIITHVARKYPTQDLEHTVMYAESFVKSGKECCEKQEFKSCLQGHFNTTADVMKNLLSNLS